jgi:hypothetical protein
LELLHIKDKIHPQYRKIKNQREDKRKQTKEKTSPLQIHRVKGLTGRGSRKTCLNFSTGLLWNYKKSRETKLFRGTASKVVAKC